MLFITTMLFIIIKPDFPLEPYLQNLLYIIADIDRYTLELEFNKVIGVCCYICPFPADHHQNTMFLNYLAATGP